MDNNLCWFEALPREPYSKQPEQLKSQSNALLEYVSCLARKMTGIGSDVEWSHLDTTCSVTVFLTVYQVTHDKKNDDRINKARKRGYDFIMNWQRDTGLWKDDTFHPAGIETTAHLMQYTP